MKVICVGGGPAGLYVAILLKKALPSVQIEVRERNQPDDTFGFGVVFSDATLDEFAGVDAKTHSALVDRLAHWDDIQIRYRDQVLQSTGHGFSGLSRRALLEVLQERCSDLGVELRFGVEIEDPEALRFEADLLVAADGANSRVRELYAEAFRPSVDWRPNRFVWLGTNYEFPAFTFLFRRNEHGLWRGHGYRYEAGRSTLILECTEETWRRTGLGEEDEAATVAYAQALFAEELQGHEIISNRSYWRNFPTVRNGTWHHENVVLLGDAAHTAHFSIGSGTKLAMEDAIALARGLGARDDLEAALARYEADRRPEVESLQRAAQVSLEWFENTERYIDRLEPIQFGFSLLTRSLRISHENLKLRDPEYVGRVDRWFAARGPAAGIPKLASGASTPPMFTPYRLRDLELRNRVVVSPMCQYSAEDGTVDDWHLVHLGSRALGGAALVITEMTDIARDARISPGCAGMYKPAHVAAWRRIVDFVHHHSDAKIGMQLAHAGRKGATRLGWEGNDRPLPPESNPWPIVAPSAIPYRSDNAVPRELDRAEMTEICRAFVRSAEMAEEAGFDLLEIHFAHGYLLSTFLSPLTNRRSDAYGGSLANRMRYPLEVFDAVRAVWPDEKPISVRISATDWAPGGFTPDDAVGLGAALKRHGCDIIDVSAGQVVSDQEPVYGRLFQTPFSERVRLEADLPTMTVGNISTYEDVNSILAAGRADLCVLARAHLYDPYWTRHAAQQQGFPLPWPDPYGVIDDYEPRF